LPRSGDLRESGYFKSKDSWGIMPSHIHMIIGSNKNKMEDI
jgi:hypothetical protein